MDSWLRRISRRALWQGGFGAVPVPPEAAVFDAETMTLLARAAIEHASGIGNCVIVRRGRRCILQNPPDVFHVFLFAPAGGAPGSVRAINAERSCCVRMNFGRNWRDPHFYDPLNGSKLGDELVVPAIPSGMGNPI